MSPLSAYSFCRTKKLRGRFNEFDDENRKIIIIFSSCACWEAGSSPLSDCKTCFVLQPGWFQIWSDAKNGSLSAPDKKWETICVHNGMLIKIRRASAAAHYIYIYIRAGQFARDITYAFSSYTLKVWHINALQSA